MFAKPAVAVKSRGIRTPDVLSITLGDKAETQTAADTKKATKQEQRVRVFVSAQVVVQLEHNPGLLLLPFVCLRPSAFPAL